MIPVPLVKKKKKHCLGKEKKIIIIPWLTSPGRVGEIARVEFPFFLENKQTNKQKWLCWESKNHGTNHLAPDVFNSFPHRTMRLALTSGHIRDCCTAFLSRRAEFTKRGSNCFFMFLMNVFSYFFQLFVLENGLQ